MTALRLPRLEINSKRMFETSGCVRNFMEGVLNNRAEKPLIEISMDKAVSWRNK